jgi:hypothetical protein
MWIRPWASKEVGEWWGRQKTRGAHSKEPLLAEDFYDIFIIVGYEGVCAKEVQALES